MNKLRCFLMILLCFTCVEPFAQNKRLSLGAAYGWGSEFSNSDYTYENHYFKISADYQLRKGKILEYELVVQPEVNFSRHQLKNLYFITPDQPDYQHKREEFTKLKKMHEYVLNVGLRLRTPITPKSSVFLMASIGPMLVDTETERLSKGFAFSDVLTLGVSYTIQKVRIEANGNLRHSSNGGLQNSNAGYNTFNFEIGTAFLL